MYDYFAKKAKLDYSHVKFRVPLTNKNNLGVTIKSLRTLGIRGINVTLPYKIKIIHYLDKKDETAVSIGAVNTILNKNNKLTGYNTDGQGAVLAIRNHLREIKPSDRILVFGAGGAARAIIFELCKITKNITIINRLLDFDKARKILIDFTGFNNELKILKLNNENIINEMVKSNFIINATSVGMFPNSNRCLLSESLLRKVNKQSPIRNKYFFDVVFNPYLTKFLLLAKNYEAKICPGLWMMIYQGVKSFKIWIGKDVSKNDIISVYHLLKRKLYEK